MNDDNSSNVSSRREFLKTSSQIAAASALAGISLPFVHAAEDNTVRIALVGCGGRGTGAANNALETRKGPVKLVAMADVFEDRLKSSYESLKRALGDRVEVADDKKYIGFDSYKSAMDNLRKGDVAIFATPPAFRWVHFKYAVDKGLNVFMEKPVTVDGPTSKRMLALGEQASAKNLKVGVGLMSRHSRALQELHRRVQDGEIGDIISMRGYRMHGPGGSAYSTKRPNNTSELLWQIRRFHSFLWASGGLFSDFYIHIVDHLCWLKNDLPIKAQGIGGRHYKTAGDGSPYIDQNFDSYAIEYTFKDGTKFFFDGRHMVGCNDIYSSYLHGSKGMAIASKANDCGLPSSTYRGQSPTRDKQIWVSDLKPEDSNPYQNEWEDLMEAIRQDKPYNEVQYGVEASVVSSLGRMAAHTGQEITYDEMLNCEHEFAPGLESLTMASDAPIRADKDGKYPIPMPGVLKNREYDSTPQA